MGCSMTKTSNSLDTVEWMWQTDADPFLDRESATWGHYSDLEMLIIDEAYRKKKPRAVLDEYYVDFRTNMQISNKDPHKQRPIQRVVRRREDKHLREARFMDLPVASDRSYGGQYGFISPFVKEARKQLGLQAEDLPSKRPELIPTLVEKAAQGLITEGKRIGRQREAQEAASQLLKKKNSGVAEVWKCCAYLYSLESFLYKTLNATMRLVGSKDDEQIWRSKLSTLGPFCLLLWDDPFNTRMKMNMNLYRGANLTREQIASYEEMTKKENAYGSFQGFSSASRNRAKAEKFGNTLFIMKVKFAFIVDVSTVSKYPEEEEELITPGVCFRVLCVDSDHDTDKHVIYLELRQRWSAVDQSHLENDSDPNRAQNGYDLEDNRDDTDDPFVADHDRDGNYLPKK